MKARSQHATGGTNMLPPPFSLFAPEIISRVTFYRSKFVPHFLTGTSQIQHLDSASRRFSFHRLIPGRISGWAGIGARPNLERRTLSLRAGTGEGSEAPRVQSLRRSLRRLYPESERPPIFCTIAPHSPHSSSGPAFSCHPFLDTPQSHRKPRSCVRPSRGKVPGPWESTSPRAPAAATAHPQPPYVRAPAHPAHPALQRDSPTPGPPPPLLLPTHHPPRLRRGTRWGLSRPVAPFPLTLGTGSGRLAIPGEAGRVPLRFLPIP